MSKLKDLYNRNDKKETIVIAGLSSSDCSSDLIKYCEADAKVCLELYETMEANKMREINITIIAYKGNSSEVAYSLVNAITKEMHTKNIKKTYDGEYIINSVKIDRSNTGDFRVNVEYTITIKEESPRVTYDINLHDVYPNIRAHSKVPHVSYKDYYKQQGLTPSNYNDIIYADRAEAQRILDKLLDTDSKCPVVSVSDYLGIAGLSCTSVDTKFGWYGLCFSHIKRVRQGYAIVLPEAKIL